MKEVSSAKEYSSLRNQILEHPLTLKAITTRCSAGALLFKMKQEIVQPDAYVALRLPSDSIIVVQVLPNTYVK